MKITKTLKKYANKAAKFLTSVYSPYMVYNAHTDSLHFAWSRKEAMEWMSCYDARKFGRTELLNYFGKSIAAKY